MLIVYTCLYHLFMENLGWWILLLEPPIIGTAKWRLPHWQTLDLTCRAARQHLPETDQSGQWECEERLKQSELWNHSESKKKLENDADFLDLTRRDLSVTRHSLSRWSNRGRDFSWHQSRPFAKNTDGGPFSINLHNWVWTMRVIPLSANGKVGKELAWQMRNQWYLW
jgi:hypothetical protein